jgi:iron complex outermembrane receptor protein
MFNFIKTTLFLLLFSCLLSPAFADEQRQGTEHDGPMEHYAVHLDEVIVSTPMQDTIASSATPVTVLHNDNLRMKAGGTIGETLQNELGVHGQAFGPGVGLPVIRGQDGPRVRVMSNGLGTNDASQNSPDHASISVPLNAERIEILRGPATLLYGSGAIGGVVNVIDNRIPEKVPDQLVGGSIEQKYNTVSNNHQTAFKFDGGKSKFAYHFDGYFQKSDDLEIGGDAIDVTRANVSQPSLDIGDNTSGFVKNTEADNLSLTAGGSFVGDSGFFGFSANVVDMEYQIPVRGEVGGEESNIEMEQRKLDFKGGLNNLNGFFSKMDAKLSFTDYEHTEALEALFQNDTFEGRVDAKHKPIFGMDGVMGFQMISSLFSANEIGGDYINPKTRTNSYAAFVQESFDLGHNNVGQFGLRIEHDVVDSSLRANPDQSFTPVSLSFSDLWTIDDKKSISLAITRSERAPIVNELYFEGDHEATATFQKGNPNLNLETSYNIDLGYKLNSKKVAFELNLFHNWVNDYIYAARTGGTGGEEDNPEVLYQQAAATFMGYEAQLVYHVWKKGSQDIDLTLFSDYTRGKLYNSGDVPRIPPLRWGFQFDHRNGNWKSNLRLTRAEKQGHTGVNEADTPSYNLLNLNTHYHIEDFKKADMVVYAKGNNLLNDNIRNSASFLRNFQPEAGIGAELGIRISY